MKRFIQNNFLLMIIINAGNVMNYIFQLVLGNNLSPESFGEFNALNSLTLLLAAPLSVLPLVISQFSIQLEIENISMVRQLFNRCIWLFMTMSVPLFLLGFLIIPFIQQFLNIKETLPIVLILFYLCIAMFYNLTLGLLQGRQHYISFGITTSSYPFFRLLCCILFVAMLQFGVSGALMSCVLGVAVSVVIGMYCNRSLVFGERVKLPDGILIKMFKYSIQVLFSIVLVLALGNIDIVLVRHFCTSQDAGLYSTAAVLGRICFFLPGVLLVVFFSSAAKEHHEGNSNSKTLLINLVLTAIISLGLALIFNIWSEKILLLLFGEQYVKSASLFGVISIAMAFLAMSHVYFHYCLANFLYFYLWILGAGVALLIILVGLYHSGPMEIARSLLLCCSSIFVITSISYHAKYDFRIITINKK